MGFLALQDGNDRFSETSLSNYYYPLRNDPEERSFQMIFDVCLFCEVAFPVSLKSQRAYSENS
jgi:hypothetical protein